VDNLRRELVEVKEGKARDGDVEKVRIPAREQRAQEGRERANELIVLSSRLPASPL
jgi:hypothetical protein